MVCRPRTRATRSNRDCRPSHQLGPVSGVDVRGIVLAGTGTDTRPEMTAFVQDVLGLTRTTVAGVEADLFDLPDGSLFAVSWPDGMGATSLSLGFLVADTEQAVRELRAAAVPVDDETSANARESYVHFCAPDGQRDELVERTPRSFLTDALGAAEPAHHRKGTPAHRWQHDMPAGADRATQQLSLRSPMSNDVHPTSVADRGGRA